jgi:hypothetical protein
VSVSQSRATDRPPDNSKSIAAAFARGLVQPSWLSLLIALALALAFFIVVGVVITPEFMRRHGDSIFGQKSTDYDMFVTTEALRLRVAGPEPMVVIFGGSTTQAAISKAFLEEVFEQRLPHAPSIYQLNTTRQTLWDLAALMEAVPDRAQGAAIIGVSPGILVRSKDELAARHRLGFRSEKLDQAFVEAGFPVRRTTGIYAMDNAEFLSARMYVCLKRGFKPIKPIQSPSHGAKPLANAEWIAHSKQVSARFNDVSLQQTDQNLQYLKGLLRELLDRTDLQILLVEAPVSERFLHYFHLESTFKELRAGFVDMAQEIHVEYLDLNEDVGFVADDFEDWGHLRNMTTVERATNATALRVLRLLNNTKDKHTSSMTDSALLRSENHEGLE